jgi:proline dehydrogenase
VEGKEEEDHFDKALKMTLKQLVSRKHQAIPFRCPKPTGRFGVREDGEKQQLTVKEQEEWELVSSRLSM